MLPAAHRDAKEAKGGGDMPQLTYQKAILDACVKIGNVLESASTDPSKSFEDCIPQVAQILDDLVAADRRGCAKFVRHQQKHFKGTHKEKNVAGRAFRQIEKAILTTIAVQMPPIRLKDSGETGPVEILGTGHLFSVTGG
jgi:hypothetical protein